MPGVSGLTTIHLRRGTEFGTELTLANVRWPRQVELAGPEAKPSACSSLFHHPESWSFIHATSSETVVPKARRAWFITVDGVQHNLGPDKRAAFNASTN